MRNFQKTISSLLAVVMTLAACQGLFGFSVFADGDSATGTSAAQTTATAAGGTSASGAASTEESDETEETLPDYTKIKFETAQAKLESIKASLKYDENGNATGTGQNLWTRNGDSYLYADAFSGEVIWLNNKTGEMLLTNPYDTAYPGTATSQNTKYDLLSQVLLTYDDAGTEKSMCSYTDACQNEQISLKYITNGIRVEYAMGDVETRKLVPRMIEKSRFESLILDKIANERDRNKLLTYYLLYDIDDPSLTDAQVTQIKKQYPITSSLAIYVFNSEASKRELSEIETIISTNTQYTFDDMNDDHAQTGYEGNVSAPAVFRFGLEYTLCDDGSMTVRLAANGIRYDEDNYQLKSISILPYFCATNNQYEGYTFLPDGSGALIENSDTLYNLSGKMYGIDYAYHQISGANQEVMRLPVFGVVQHTNPVVVEESDVEQTDEDDVTISDEERRRQEQAAMDELGITGGGSGEDGENGTADEPAATEPEPTDPGTTEVVTKPANSFGYLAVIEEGASVATITSSHGGSVYKYSSVYTRFTPRATDTYDLSNSLSVGGNTSYTVSSKRKYTGNYTLRYYMLTDDTLASKAGMSKDDYYEVSYVGMAKAYQDYLVANNVLTPLTNGDVKNDLPLYIESFGAIDTSDTFLSVPVTVKTPLTTFDDLKTMYQSLSDAGITNVNFRLTGFTNGGMKSTAPYHVKFIKQVGGNSDYKDFLTFAQENNIGVFPDFDFSYVKKTSLFDGFSMKKQAVRTIDSRYTTKQEYSAIWQKFNPSNEIAVSAASIKDIYDNFTKEYQKLGSTAISVSTLGSDLNSDFDKKDPSDRSDSQQYIENVLARIDSEYGNVMIDGGNSYALKYADHILNISLDSSRYAKASKSIPFMAMVLHGYVQYAGTPTNMASDSTYELLKMVENGANPYFMLSYENLAKIKDSGDYTKYYSVSFTIWFEDLVKTYEEMNDAIGSLQTQTIVDHSFLAGTRDHTAAEEVAGANFDTDSGTIVRVKYSGGTVFYINYNDYDVTTEDGVKIPADSFVKR